MADTVTSVRGRTHPISGPATGLLLTALVAALVAALVTGISIGSVSLPLGQVWGVVLAYLTGHGAQADPLLGQVVWEIRTPRALLATLAGAGLSVAGVALQALVRNPLADPYVLGVSSAASLGAVLVPALGSTVVAGAFGVTGATWADLGVPALLVVCCLAWLVLQARALNALTAGEDAAIAMGVPVAALRIGLLVAGSLLTATVVSVVGGIGFIGLMIPHMVRFVVGADHRRVLPVSLLTGALFVVLVDLAARTADRPNELPVGIFTTGLGVPFFLWLLRRRAKGGTDAA